MSKIAMRGWERTDGRNSRTRKLSAEQAQAILDLRGTGKTQAKVASTFGVSETCVRDIWRRNTWQELDG